MDNFHERTKQQAAQDRARERTIVRHGYIIHRFTGSEVYRNPRKCVEEVIQLITLPAR
jgi:very-short-patch-repair endonuclease